MWKDQRLGQCGPLQRRWPVERRTGRGEDDEVQRVLGATCPLCELRRGPACSGEGELSERNIVQYKPVEWKGGRGVRQQMDDEEIVQLLYNFSGIQEDLSRRGGLHCAYPSFSTVVFENVNVRANMPMLWENHPSTPCSSVGIRRVDGANTSECPSKPQRRKLLSTVKSVLLKLESMRD